MRNRTHRRLYLIPVTLLALFGIAADGSVGSLSVSGGGNFNETITINATVRADSKVQNSNLHFEIRAPDGTVVATNNTSVPSLNDGESFSYSWSSNNGGYPAMGNYSVSICWSPGNSGNCNITGGPVTTTFYSVPTFGEVLTILALALVALWFWHVRRQMINVQGAAA